MSIETAPGMVRPPTVGSYQLTPRDYLPEPDKGWSGVQSGDLQLQVDAWVRAIHREGHATTETGYRPANHVIIGTGVGHQDDQFADVGTSHAAWLENGYGELGDLAVRLAASRLTSARARYARTGGALNRQEMQQALQELRHAEFIAATTRARATQEGTSR